MDAARLQFARMGFASDCMVPERDADGLLFAFFEEYHHKVKCHTQSIVGQSVEGAASNTI